MVVPIYISIYSVNGFFPHPISKIYCCFTVDGTHSNQDNVKSHGTFHFFNFLMDKDAGHFFHIFICIVLIQIIWPFMTCLFGIFGGKSLVLYRSRILNLCQKSSYKDFFSLSVNWLLTLLYSLLCRKFSI